MRDSERLAVVPTMVLAKSRVPLVGAIVLRLIQTLGREQIDYKVRVNETRPMI